MVKCNHTSLYNDCSPAAQEAGFERPPLQAAVSQTGNRPRNSVPEDPWTFPGPLVLPEDELAMDPDDDGQTFKEWLDGEDRNKVTTKKKKLYVVLPPTIPEELGETMKDWHKPILPGRAAGDLEKWTSSTPQVTDLIDYLRCFYHGMDVVQYPATFTWQVWDEKPKSKTRSKTTKIGLETPGKSEVWDVRCRPSLDGRARQQVHLGDVADALLRRIPKDAHAVVMLTDYDLYEDEEDDFTVGRAWGGSRVCIVSSFRYNPALDEPAGIDRAHMWPNSHCKTFIDNECSTVEKEPPAKRTKSSIKPYGKPPPTSPLALAVQASRRVPKLTTRDELSSYWFARLAVTVSHELGHCFGFAHCPYYACVMQGVNSVRQDGQVPPYLCPVDAAKLAWELGPLLDCTGSRTEKQSVWIRQQNEALREFCGRWSHVPQFAGFEAWLGGRLVEK
ncbi:hypothetical protein NW752_008617 [Fusarium irregulare]|nr:hypothetical protein NW752_008617 [Fusarium irregulare]